MERKNVNNNSSFLKMMDVFETPITLSYNKKYSYDTKFGGFLTIITVLIIVAYSISLLNDLFQGNSYSLTSNESEDYKYILDFSNVPFAFKLMNSKGEDFPLDPKIYNFKIINTEYYYVQNPDEKVVNYIEENIEFDHCEKFVKINKIYNFLNISNLMCIKPGQNLTMYGIFGDIGNGFKGFRIYINRCNTKSENNTCLDIETINKKLANIKFQYFYLGYEINHYSNNKNIIQNKIFNAVNSLSINFMKKFYYKFQKTKYNLYNNLLYNYQNTKYFYITDGYTYDFELDSSNSLASSDDSLGYFAFNTNGKIIEYTKTLNNFWDVFSKIGGVFNIVISISKIINTFISKRLLLLDVNDHLINDFSKTNFNKNKIKQDIKTIFNLDNEIIQNKEFFVNENSSIEIKNKNEKLFELNERNCCINRKSKKNNSLNNIANIALFSRKQESISKILKPIKNVNKQSKFWFFICPFTFLRKIKKFKYFYQLEQNFCGYFSIENFLKVLKINKISIEKNSDSR